MSMPSLKYYKEFKDVLGHYQISKRAKQALDGLQLVLMVATSSTGRNTMIRELLKTGRYHFIVSDTTRPPQTRDGKLEENGVNYFFRTEEEILADLKAGEYLEAAIIHEQQVSGINIRELENSKSQGKIAITDIEIVGADNIMRVQPGAIAIFFVPPSFEEWQNRLARRGRMTNQELKNRLSGAEKEFEAALKHNYYHFVIADDLARTVPLVDKIAHGEKDETEQQKGRQVVNLLLKQLKGKLRSWHS